MAVIKEGHHLPSSTWSGLLNTLERNDRNAKKREMTTLEIQLKDGGPLLTEYQRNKV